MAVNKAGNYTKPTMRKRIFNRIKSQASHGTKAGQWSARKAQALAKAYKKAGGGYKSWVLEWEKLLYLKYMQEQKRKRKNLVRVENNRQP